LDESSSNTIEIKQAIFNACYGGAWLRVQALLDLCICVSEESTNQILTGQEITSLVENSSEGKIISTCFSLFTTGLINETVENDALPAGLNFSSWMSIFKARNSLVSGPVLKDLKRLTEFHEAIELREEMHAALRPLLEISMAASMEFLQTKVSEFEQLVLVDHQDDEDSIATTVTLIIELINAIVVSDESSLTHKLLNGRLGNLFGLLGPYLQIPKSDESEWLQDPNAFIANEQDEFCRVSVRLAFEGLLADLLDHPGLCKQVVPAILTSAVDLMRNASSWRVQEGGLFMVSYIDDGKFDTLYREILIACMRLCQESEFPFLKARAFIVLSQVSRATDIPVSDSMMILECCVRVMGSGDKDVVKYSASRAFISFLPVCYSSKVDVKTRILQLLLDPASGAITAFIRMTRTEGESLHYGLDAIRAITHACPEIVVELGNAYYTFLRDVLQEHNRDPIVPACIEELVEEIGNAVPAAEYSNMCEIFCPVLIPWLHVDAEHELDIALDILNVLVQHCTAPFRGNMLRCLEIIKNSNLGSVGSYTAEKISDILRTCAIRHN